MPAVPIAQLKRLAPPLLVLSLITNFAILVSPIFMMQVLDRVVPTGNLNTLALLLMVALTALLLQSGVEFLRDISFQRAAFWAEKVCLPSILASDAAARDGHLANLAIISSALSGHVAVAALSLPWLPFFLLVLWVIHPLFLVMAVGLIGTSIAIRLLSNTLLAAWHSKCIQFQTAEKTALRDAEDVVAISGMPVLTQNLMDRFVAAKIAGNNVAEEMSPISTGTNAIAGFIRAMTQLLGLSLGAALVVGGDLSAGGMIAASLILTKTVTSFETVVNAAPQLRTAAQAFRNLASVSAIDQNLGTHIPDLSGALRCAGLIFPRGGGAPPRLDRISFELEPGACLAIVGSSGSGKTTLLESLSGIAPCPIGSVLLDESEVKTLPIDCQNIHIGYLAQQAQLFHGSLAENICGFAPDRNDERIIAAAKTAGVHGLISALPASYDTDIGAQPYLLSAGQKQRVALARAIYREPTYLFLDEPNALLDAAGERQLCETLARLKKMGTTIVMVIHRSGVMGLADFVMALENGRIADFGPRSEVLGRMSGGRRRVEIPLDTNSMQDLVDWVNAQFTRSNDTELARRTELIAIELFNLASASLPQIDARTAVFHFRFLSNFSCELTLTEDRPTDAQSKIKKIASLMHHPEVNMVDLPPDEVALAVISQVSDTFDINNIEGQSIFRAALSMAPETHNEVAKH